MTNKKMEIFSFAEFCKSYPEKKYFKKISYDYVCDIVLLLPKFSDDIIDIEKVCVGNKKICVIVQSEVSLQDNLEKSEVDYFAAVGSRLNVKFVGSKNKNNLQKMKRRFYADTGADVLVHGVINSASCPQQEYKLNCIDHGCSIDLKLGFEVGSNQKVKIITEQNHNYKNTKSSVLVKSVVSGDGNFEYQGVVKIEKNASGIVARQYNKNLILGNQAKVNSVPSLEILNDDVQCSHGCTICYLNKEQERYCNLFGLDGLRAKCILKKGFLSVLQS